MLTEEEKQKFLQDMRDGEAYHIKAIIAAVESVRDNSDAPQESRDEALEMIALLTAELESRKQSA